MKDHFIPPKGFRNLEREQSHYMENIRKEFTSLAKSYGAEPISLSTVCYSKLFTSHMQDSSVIVSKELIELNKKDQCLRPEMTLPTITQTIREGIYTTRKYYVDNCFRGERSQKDRFRQFTQFGVEFLGGDVQYNLLDAICLLKECLDYLPEINYELQINCLGNNEERNKYCKALTKYFKLNKHLLSMESQKRLERGNVLRILDSKQDDNIIRNAPQIREFLSYETQDNFQKIIDITGGVENPLLVRGLDYYDGVVFEILDQKTGLALAGGGSYGRIYQIVNSNIKNTAVGFAIGIDRLFKYMMSDKDEKKVIIFSEEFNQNLLYILRNKFTDYSFIPWKMKSNTSFTRIMKKFHSNTAIISQNGKNRIFGQPNKNIELFMNNLI